jgi:hypothetical protein
MSGLGKDQMAALDPTAMSGLGATQAAGMAPTAMSGLSKDQMAALGADAMGGFGATQMAALAPTAMAGLGADQMGGMTAAAMGGLVADQMGGLTKDALGGISTDQFAALGGDALGGLKSENLGGLGADVIGNMSIDDLANLDPAEVQGMADIAKLVTNLNAFSVDTDTVAALLPDGWTIDSTGDMTAPPGAEINFKELPKAPPPLAGEPAVVALPDLSSNLALGAGSGAPSVLDGMDNALVSAGVSGFDFKQSSSGVLNIGDGTGGPPVAAFIPDAANMTQAAADADPGVSVDPETGGYIIITDQGYQIPLKPSVSNPAEVASLVGSDSKVSLGSSGEITIEAPPSADGTVTAIAGIASPLLTTDERPAGTYTDGTGVDAVLTIVYADGSAQTLAPAIKDQVEFEASAAAIPGVTDLVFKVDGSVSLAFDGAPVTLKPLFDVVKGVPGAAVTPGISNEDGKFFFTSANGDKQEFATGS